MSGDQPLTELYPFLHGGRHDTAALRAALLESVRHKADDSVATKQRFLPNTTRPWLP